MQVSLPINQGQGDISKTLRDSKRAQKGSAYRGSSIAQGGLAGTETAWSLAPDAYLGDTEHVPVQS